MKSNLLLFTILIFLFFSISNSQQQYNCIQGFSYNATYSSCMPTSITCPQGSAWNSQICIYSQNCPPNSVSNGTNCVSYSNACPSGYFGNTSQCFRCPNGFVQYYNSIQCTINFGNCSAGSYWTGSSCTNINQLPQNNINPTLPPVTGTSQNTNVQIGTNPNTGSTQILNSNTQFPINQNNNQVTTPAAGQSILCSEGFYWSGSQCAYYNGAYNCITNYVWNGTHCSNTTLTQNIPNNLLLTQSNLCNSPYYWNGNACVYTIGQPTCIQGHIFNTSINTCVAAPISTQPQSRPTQATPQPLQQASSNCNSPYYFNGAACVYNTGQPQCLNNFVFNLTSNQCQAATSQTQNVCNPPFYFNGINCMYNGGQILCASGFVSNGTGCIPQQILQPSARSPADCNSSTFWNGINCVPFNGYINCSSGYSWNGQQCAMSPPPSCNPGSVVNPSTNMCVPSTQSFCLSGSFWNGESCVRYTGQYTCIQRFYYNGVNCVPNVGYVNALNNQNVPLSI